MRFTRLAIDGFGRIADTQLDLAPRVQIVFGPNEGGKSTLRYFIADMLYGQKRSQHKRIYDDGNALRTPWANNARYGGRLTYQLDSGTVIEVERVFSADDESVRVFDRTSGREITGEFPVLKNKEIAFAEGHLNMSKAVFLGVATISHVTLSDLGDRQALIHIREKLLSLTDSAEEDHSAEKAIRALRERVAIIGDKNARTRPLPIMRQRLTDLQAEHQEVYEAMREIDVYEKRRVAVLDEIGALRNRRSDLEKAILLRDRSERAEIVRRADALQARIDEVTRQTFSLNGVREFPLARRPEVLRLATLTESAAQSLRQKQERLDAILRERDGIESKLSGQGVPLMKEADGEWETKLADLDKQIGMLNERIEQVEQTAAKGAAIFAEAEQMLKQLPDFSRFKNDPVQHFTSLAGAHDVSRRALADEEQRLDALRRRAESQEAALEAPRGLYANRPDFVAELRAYEAGMQESYASGRERDRERALLQQHLDDLSGRFPGYVIMTFVGLVGVIALVIVASVTGNSGINIATFFVGLMAIFFLAASQINRHSQREARAQLDAVNAEESAEKSGRDTFEEIMNAAGCNTLRELEAAYDRYREQEQALSLVRTRIAEQEAAVAEARERLDQCERELQDAFAAGGEEPNGDTPEKTLARVLTRYQEYRDCKRRLGESREARERSEREQVAARARLESLRQQDVELSLSVRQFLRENHFPEEHQYDSALKALRNYRIRSAQMRQKQAELDVIQGQVKLVRREFDADQAEHDRLRGQLDQELAAAAVATLEEFEARAGEAERFVELSRERTSLEEQLAVAIGDHDLDRLRAEMAEDAPKAKVPEVSADTLKSELALVQADLEAKRKQEHALQLMIAERGSGHRSLNEVDEERAATEQRVAELELELKSATYAMTAITEVTRSRHTQIAPKLAYLASHYLEQITSGVYKEVLIDEDMQISVRIPQTQAINPDPARLLSKGTVDQIYFALRLAMVRCMSEGGEQVPMVLDDPFANYDDQRLKSAMELLAEIGGAHQVILFTCREDVVRTAESVGAPIIRL